MIASLLMYDWPQIRPVWDELWTLFADEFRKLRPEADCPDALDWDAPHDGHWTRPDLFLSQTCSLPFRSRLKDRLTLLGAFDFGLPDCPPGHYNSVLVQRKGQREPKGRAITLAYNAPDSQSGWAAPLAHGVFRFHDGIETGSHAASAQAVAEGRADLAAIDAQTYRLLTRFDPVMTTLEEVARTQPTPGLPLITAQADWADEIALALERAVPLLPETARDMLGLLSFKAMPPEAYLALPLPQAPDRIFRR